MSLEQQLHEGIVALGLDRSAGVDAAAEGRLMAYLRLMVKWNRTYNLTAIRDEAEMVSHHLLDSLTLAPYVQGLDALADVGSGAGLPGIPLALVFPELKITSIETVTKKVAFQQQAKIELKLANFTVLSARVEKTQGQFAAVTSRAFAELADFVNWSGHLLRPEGRLLAMKGVYPEEEIARLPRGWQVTESHELKVPGLVAQRHLIVIKKI
ncbi:MAG: 16S rRNA (guanine(527)-N(7))-methyltransferase RsmG [Rhodocyclaceae bacterium]|nr:MAG: 16S rRNA (guanine(527)-N(7))-methyltransferase RsmG [Rhodocyclaceae bacterium]